MSSDSAYRKILRLMGRVRDSPNNNNNNEEPEYEYGSVPERLRGRLERNDQYLIRRGAYLFKELVKSTHGKNNSFRIFSLKEIQKATNNFSADLILRDSLHPTYRGVIEDRHVAVKIVVWMDEVVSLSLIKHRNVVKLLGCCLETDDFIFVHELPPNGTLREYIFPEKLIIPPPVELLWTDRLRIAMEIGDALSYLHSELHITHGRLWWKSAILLDEFLSAKLGAFDHSKIQNQAESSDVETDIRNKRRKHKDVGEFGKILLNLLCIQTDDRNKFTKCKEKVEILNYLKLNVSEKEMAQIEAYIDLLLRCRPQIERKTTTSAFLPSTVCDESSANNRWKRIRQSFKWCKLMPPHQTMHPPHVYERVEHGEDKVPSMEEVARELRRIRSM